MSDAHSRPIDDDATPVPPSDRRIEPEQVRRVRLGTGANCSSVGSVVDTLFVTATLGAALIAGVLAALRSEEVRVVGDAAGDPQGKARGGGDPETGA